MCSASTPMALGRTFGEADDKPGAAAVAVIGRRYWMRRFAMSGDAGRQPR